MENLTNFMNDFLEFQKKFWNPSEDSEYWDDMLDESRNLIEKYDNNAYFFDLVVSFMNAKEREVMSNAA